jgi:hypothetical protein
MSAVLKKGEAALESVHTDLDMALGQNFESPALDKDSREKSESEKKLQIIVKKLLDEHRTILAEVA